MNTNFYYIVSNDEDLDLVVEATSVKEAIKMWGKWLIDSEYEEDDGVLPNPRFVFLIPEKAGESRILEWHNQDGLNAVYGKLT
jgi:hypothetical protein